MEIVLVEARSRKRWVIPKGLIEPGLEAGESAAKEAYEEAGVRGELSQAPVGAYSYRKWGVQLDVDVYLLRVTAVLDVWPEDRRRRWLSPVRAAELLRELDLRRLVVAAPLLLASIHWRGDGDVSRPSLP
jgi:8-oxo-dGTP pyrophosphatase MutT (NUDIX family)